MRLFYPPMLTSLAALVIVTMLGTRAYVIEQFNRGNMVPKPIDIHSVETVDGIRGRDTTVKVRLTYKEACAPLTTSLQFTDTAGFIFVAYAKWTPVPTVGIDQTRTFIIHINKLATTGQVRDVVLAMEDWICDGKRNLLPRLEKQGSPFKVKP